MFIYGHCWLCGPTMIKATRQDKQQKPRLDILRRHVDGGLDLDRNKVYAAIGPDGYDASYQTFVNDIKRLDISGRFRDARQDSKGRPRQESTKRLREWLIQRMPGVHDGEGAVSVRRVYYLILGEADAWFGKGVFGKSEDNYKMVGKMLSELRRERMVPYEWIAESSRHAELFRLTEIDVSSEVTWRLEEGAADIRRNPWRGISERCEIWFEKDTVSHVFSPICGYNHVPMVSCHGMNSITLLRDTAKRIMEHNKVGRRVTIYYFGDLDKSGLDIPRNIERDMGEHADCPLDWTFEHLGIRPEQVEKHGFLTHPRKKSKNEKNAPIWAPEGWDGETVCELDAASPSLLRGWVEEAIRKHLTVDALEKNTKIESEWKDEAKEVVDEIRQRCGDIMERYGVH